MRYQEYNLKINLKSYAALKMRYFYEVVCMVIHNTQQDGAGTSRKNRRNSGPGSSLAHTFDFPKTLLNFEKFSKIKKLSAAEDVRAIWTQINPLLVNRTRTEFYLCGIQISRHLSDFQQNQSIWSRLFFSSFSCCFLFCDWFAFRDSRGFCEVQQTGKITIFSQF
jgi:hypothetical protein